MKKPLIVGSRTGDNSPSAIEAAPPPDLAFFMRALDEVPQRVTSFDPIALVRVEWAWEARYEETRMFGWIVSVTTEQRFYLEMAVREDAGSELETDLEITCLAEESLFPDELEDLSWYRPDHINRHLGLRVLPLN